MEILGEKTDFGKSKSLLEVELAKVDQPMPSVCLTWTLL